MEIKPILFCKLIFVFVSTYWKFCKLFGKINHTGLLLILLFTSVTNCFKHMYVLVKTHFQAFYMWPAEQKLAVFAHSLNSFLMLMCFLQWIRSGLPKFQPLVIHKLGDTALESWNSKNLYLYRNHTENKLQALV